MKKVFCHLSFALLCTVFHVNITSAATDVLDDLDVDGLLEEVSTPSAPAGKSTVSSVKDDLDDLLAEETPSSHPTSATGHAAPQHASAANVSAGSSSPVSAVAQPNLHQTIDTVTGLAHKATDVGHKVLNLADKGVDVGSKVAHGVAGIVEKAQHATGSLQTAMNPHAGAASGLLSHIPHPGTLLPGHHQAAQAAASDGLTD